MRKVPGPSQTSPPTLNLFWIAVVESEIPVGSAASGQPKRASVPLPILNGPVKTEPPAKVSLPVQVWSALSEGPERAGGTMMPGIRSNDLKQSGLLDRDLGRVADLDPGHIAAFSQRGSSRPD